MKNLIIVGAVLVLVLVTSVSSGSEITVKSDNMYVSDGRDVTYLSGNIVITVEKGFKMSFASKHMHKNINKYFGGRC